MILECGNIVATRFWVQKKHPDTIRLLDCFVQRMHRTMVGAEHVDLCSQFAYKDESHPLMLQARPGLKSKSRPLSAPATGRVGVPMHDWCTEVTEGVREVGRVTAS